MKQFSIFLIIFGFLCVQLQAQNTNSNAVVQNYQKSLETKDDFWSKLKGIFKSKKHPKEIVRTSEPVLVKNDPNRTLRRPRRISNRIEETDNAAQEGELEKPQQKNAIGKFWNKLVNGNGYVAEKDYNAIHKKKNETESRPEVTQQVLAPKKLSTLQEQRALSQKLAKSNRDARDAKKAPNPVVIAKVVSEVKAAPPVSTVKTNQSIKAGQVDRRKLNEKKPNAVRENVVASPKMEAPKSKTVEAPVVVDNTIRNEIKPLSLTQVANGTASYFYSGASIGKFYVVTNVATKGSMVKVTNVQNGKSILAEVLDYLPSTDTKRGIILKLSDNAKLPLGQNNNTFGVKVNY